MCAFTNYRNRWNVRDVTVTLCMLYVWWWVCFCYQTSGLTAVERLSYLLCEKELTDPRRKVNAKWLLTVGVLTRHVHTRAHATHVQAHSHVCTDYFQKRPDAAQGNLPPLRFWSCLLGWWACGRPGREAAAGSAVCTTAGKAPTPAKKRR